MSTRNIFNFRGYNRLCYYIYTNGNFIFARCGSVIWFETNVTFVCFGATYTDAYADHITFFTFNFTRCFKGFQATKIANFAHDDGVFADVFGEDDDAGEGGDDADVDDGVVVDADADLDEDDVEDDNCFAVRGFVCGQEVVRLTVRLTRT